MCWSTTWWPLCSRGHQVRVDLPPFGAAAPFAPPGRHLVEPAWTPCTQPRQTAAESTHRRKAHDETGPACTLRPSPRAGAYADRSGRAAGRQRSAYTGGPAAADVGPGPHLGGTVVRHHRDVEDAALRPVRSRRSGVCGAHPGAARAGADLTRHRCPREGACLACAASGSAGLHGAERAPPGDNWQDRSGLGCPGYFAERPRQLSRALDEVLGDARWSTSIDAARIAAVGHSVGGHSVLVSVASPCGASEDRPTSLMAFGSKLRLFHEQAARSGATTTVDQPTVTVAPPGSTPCSPIVPSLPSAPGSNCGTTSLLVLSVIDLSRIRGARILEPLRSACRP